MKICLVCEGISDTEKDHCAACGLRLVETSEVHFPLRRGEEDASNPLLGVLIDGKYRISNVLGKGGMGTVYRAVHEVSLVPVALKILHPRFGSRADYRDHFVAEARKAGRVVHEHSARVLDVGEDADGTVYIAMELVEGVTLSEWVHADQKLGAAQVVEIMHQICQALAVAHDVGLVHRDLTPRNVMGVVREGRPFVKILDFGISRGAPTPQSVAFADADGMAAPAGFANPPYSAPEHLAGEEVDARADLYSLGVIAYEALTRKLPVRGNNKREFAAATLAGSIQPLRAPPGTPGRLVRLIQRLLSKSPDERPASARDVRRELDRIRNPRVPLLRVGSVTALLVTLPAFIVTHAEQDAVFLSLRGSSKFYLTPQWEADVQYLRSAHLARLEFRFGGFDPGELELTALGGGEISLESLALDVNEDVLILSTETSPEYSAFLQKLAEAEHPFDLEFGIPGEPTLGYARVAIDDEAPVVSLWPQVSTLNGESTVAVNAVDKDSESSVVLHVKCGDETPRRLVLDGPAHGLPAKQLLGDDFGGARAYENVTMWAEAEDRAGNVGTSDERFFEKMDLQAPRIRKIEGTQGQLGLLVTYTRDKARLRIEVDEAEQGAVVRIRPPEGRPWELGLSATSLVTEIELERRGDDEAVPFADGPYTFVIRDAAGNSSVAEEYQLRFQSEDPRARLSTGDFGAQQVVPARVLADEKRVLTDGSPVTFTFECNDLYEPIRVSLLSAAGSKDIELVEPARGGARFTLPALPDGVYTLSIALEDQTGAVPAQEYELRVLEKPVELRLPDTFERRFVNELQEEGLVKFDETNGVGVGNAWVPSEEVALTGKVWLGLINDPAPYPLSRELHQDLRFLSRPILSGLNVLGVQLEDQLGRPVVVRIGGRIAPDLEGRTGVKKVAEFWYSRGDMEANPPNVDVEYGQKTTVVIQAPLPFREGDVGRIRLELGTGIAPLKIEPDGEDASSLVFSIPYEILAGALEWVGRAPEELAAGLEQELSAWVTTPARRYEISVICKSIRSKLKAVSWGDVCADSAELSGVLRSIAMVPVLRPSDGEYDDPVKAVSMRSEFRPMPPLPVSNVRDIFLQSTEITRGQYQDLLRHFGRPAAHQRPDDGEFVHPWDPEREGRLQRLLPVPFEQDAKKWEHAVQTGPDVPVTGVNFFQAYTMSRIAGFVLAGDPALLRLPMGLELELAALDAKRPGVLRGCEELRFEAFGDMARRRDGVGSWPPTIGELREAGDFVTLRGGYEDHDLIGLDFGVREWVFDLPYQQGMEGHDVLREWLGNHRTHLQRAAGGGDVPTPALRSSLSRYGVVRGAALGDLRALLDTNRGVVIKPDDRAVPYVPSSVPGVTRVLILQRDGRGLLDAHDPHLREIGFRLVGGEAFVVKAREAGS